MKITNISQDQNKTKYVCIFATQRDSYLLNNPQEDDGKDGYVSIFFRNEDEGEGLEGDICDFLFSHGFDIADENNVELAKGQLQLFKSLMGTDPVISTLVAYDPNMQREFATAEHDQSVYDFEYPESI